MLLSYLIFQVSNLIEQSSFCILFSLFDLGRRGIQRTHIQTAVGVVRVMVRFFLVLLTPEHAADKMSLTERGRVIDLTTPWD